MKNLNEMSKAEMEAEIAFARNFVNNGGCMNQEQWNRVLKLMELVKVRAEQWLTRTAWK
ncbi:MAG: hypothetical protein ACLTGJ_02360 [Faecalibacterium prausnitzii]